MGSPLLRRLEEIKGISAVLAAEVLTQEGADHIGGAVVQREEANGPLMAARGAVNVGGPPAEGAEAIAPLEETQEPEEGAGGDEADEE